MEEKTLLEDIKRNVVLGHQDETDEGFDGDMEGEPGVVELVEKAVSEGIATRKVLSILTEGMEEVGAKHESGEYLIPDMLASAESVGAAMDILEPHLKEDDEDKAATILISTVEGDLHDIGKNIVITMLKGAGYNVIDLGINISSDKIVEAVKKHEAAFLGLSALLTTTMVHMETVIKKLKEAGIRDTVKVLVGGAPTSVEFAEKIGADAYCRDAFDAIEKIKEMEKSA